MAVLKEADSLDSRGTDLYQERFRDYLTSKNMSANTTCVYCYAVRQFFEIHKELTIATLQLYKVYLLEHYKPQTVNLRIRALNCYMEYLNHKDSKMTMIKIQQKMYLDRIISQADYEYLKRRLWEDGEFSYYFVIRYMAATGVRIRAVSYTHLDVYKRQVIEGDTFTFKFKTGSNLKGAGINGFDDDKLYTAGKQVKADKDDKYKVYKVTTGADNYCLVEGMTVTEFLKETKATSEYDSKKEETVWTIPSAAYTNNVKYYLLNSSGTVIKSKTGAKDSDDYKFTVKNKVITEVILED